jgi:alkylation response protein AidB-like acyl-CoA dehydrogenase
MGVSHYLVDERDVNFVLFDWLNIGQLSKFPKMQEIGFDETVARDMLKTSLKFTNDQLSPLWKDMDQTGGCKYADGKVITPANTKEVFKAYCENGFLGLCASPEYGGFGMPQSLNIAATEFFNGANIAFSMYAELTFGAAHLFEAFGSQWMREKYVGNMYAGKWGGTMCLTEPGAGSDVGALKTKAYRQSDGSFKIVGTKIFISGGDHDLTENIIHPVLARIEGAPEGIKGISLFLVPKHLVNEDGSIGAFNDVSTGGIEHKLGIKGNATAILNFGESNNCTGWLVGEENQGIVYMFQMMNEARLYVGLQGHAIGATAYMNAVKYAKERIQFAHVKDSRNPDAPKVAIVEHPDIRRMLMNMKALSEGMRAMLYKVAYWADLAHYTDAGDEKAKFQGLIDILIPICKAYCTDYAFDITEMAIQTYGGYGYIQEYPAEQYMRDVKICSLYEGTNGIQALDLLGRKLTMKGGMLFMYYMQELAGFVQSNLEHPVFGPLVKELEKAQNALAETVMGFQMTMAEGGMNMLLPVLNAKPFLDAMGHITLTWVLIDMAIMCQDKFEALCAAKKVATSDKKAVRAFIEENDEAKFYYGKIQSANWFAANMLPQSYAVFETIKAKDLSAMKVVF